MKVFLDLSECSDLPASEVRRIKQQYADLPTGGSEEVRKDIEALKTFVLNLLWWKKNEAWWSPALRTPEQSAILKSHHPIDLHPVDMPESMRFALRKLKNRTNSQIYCYMGRDRRSGIVLIDPPFEVAKGGYVLLAQWNDGESQWPESPVLGMMSGSPTVAATLD